MNEIKENFVSGYDIGSDNDYNRLLNIVREKYGNIEMPSKRSVQAMIDRYDFIQIDRGKATITVKEVLKKGKKKKMV